MKKLFILTFYRNDHFKHTTTSIIITMEANKLATS